MSAAALIQLGLALLPEIKTGVVEFVAWINSLRTTLRQTGEWTSEHEEKYREKLLAKGLAPEEMPDPK